jgi:hypothetical protein
VDRGTAVGVDGAAECVCAADTPDGDAGCDAIAGAAGDTGDCAAPARTAAAAGVGCRAALKGGAPASFAASAPALKTSSTTSTTARRGTPRGCIRGTSSVSAITSGIDRRALRLDRGLAYVQGYARSRRCAEGPIARVIQPFTRRWSLCTAGLTHPFIGRGDGTHEVSRAR